MRAEGRGKREKGRGKSSLFLLPLALSLFPLAFLSACGKPPKDAKGDKKKGDEKSIVRDVDFGAGDTTVFTSAEPKAPVSFTVVWERGGLNAANGDIQMGHLNVVSGDLYSNGKKSSRYRADRGDAVRADKRLTLTGHVVVTATDGKQSIQAPRAEYHGDVEFVRAMGGVTAEGPFGTLSGVPELWATPDFRIIGTPDMVSQTLKIPSLIALAATAAQAAPIVQKGVDYKLDGPRSVLLKGVKGSKDYEVTIRPTSNVPVTVTMVSRNMVFTSAGQVVMLIDGNTQEVKNLHSQGAAQVVQTKPGKKVTLSGTGADYDTKGSTTSGTVDLGGRVTITSVSDEKDGNQTKTRTVIAKGDHGTAVLLSKPAAGADPIKTATLSGNVTIDVTGASGKFNGKGDKLVYTPNGTGAQAVMTGKLSFGGDSPAYLGTVEGADTATINLTKDGWEDVLLEDSGGKTITTTVDKKNTPPPKKGGGPR